MLAGERGWTQGIDVERRRGRLIRVCVSLAWNLVGLNAQWTEESSARVVSRSNSTVTLTVTSGSVVLVRSNVASDGS